MTALYSVITALTFFIMPAPTTLYDYNLDPIVTLPTGYFVMQNSEIPPSGYISVIYDDLMGYVKTTDVTAVDYIPVNKYETTVKFKCDNDGQPVNLRSAPYRNADIITVLDATASGRSYGTTSGDALIQGVGETWYYVNINGVRGYCYCAHIKVDPTPPNIIEKEDPEPSEPTVTDPTAPEEQPPTALPQYTAIIFIVVLCIPVPFIMFYLFKKPKTDDEEK